MMRILAKIFGTYVVYPCRADDDKVRGWVWRDILYFDLRQRKKFWWEAG